MLFQEIIFWSLAVVGVAAALGVVLLRDLFRSALLLVLLFLTIAGHFFLLAAEFLGVVQVLIYAGAISILVIFAIMLTQNVQQGNLPNRMHVAAGMVSALMLAALAFVFIDVNWTLLSDLPAGAGGAAADRAFVDTTGKLANLLLENYALAFATAGALLLASIIGALSLVRER